MNRHLLVLLSGSLLLSSCATTKDPQLYEGLGGQSRKVTTESVLTQRYFDQGLALCWGFNHDEAILAFEAAARHDPECAMAWWGIAFALGPNINLPLTDEAKVSRAYRAAQRAMALVDRTTEAERALIEAVAVRYANPQPEDRGPLDIAYAEAMGDAWTRFPHDPDVGTLTADSLMLLSNRWRRLHHDGDRGPHTPKIIAMLERILGEHENHTGANHFYIHAVEASTRPERGLPSADRLADLAPGLGHIVHMPSHIYIRVGEYAKAMASNARAIEVDDAYFATAGTQRVYHGYRAHNHHFLAWSAMFQGAQEESMAIARAMVEKIPMDDVKKLPKSLESYLFVPVHVMMRFGLWEEILREPAPREEFPIAMALWHHARGVAYANTSRIPQALLEEKEFERVASTIQSSEKVRGAKVDRLMDLARNMMKGEILFKQGRRDEGLAALRKAVEIEDSIPYAEPPGWMQPIRHALGALLLEDDRVKEAEVVYRADLARHANNGWSLHGLAECQRRQKQVVEAAATQAAFATAWQRADIKITASCFCRSQN